MYSWVISVGCHLTSLVASRVLESFSRQGRQLQLCLASFGGCFLLGFVLGFFFGRSPSTLRTVAFGDPEPWHSRRRDVMPWGGNQAVYCAALGTRWIKRGFGEVSYILK